MAMTAKQNATRNNENTTKSGYAVIGSLNGSYAPFYHSGVVDSEEEARRILEYQKEQAREDSVHTGNDVVETSEDRFEISRDKTQINYIYKVVQI